MNEYEKFHLRPECSGSDTDPGGHEAAAAAERARIDRLIGAADAAIARALSGDSERYVSGTRQRGGQ